MGNEYTASVVTSHEVQFDQSIAFFGSILERSLNKVRCHPSPCNSNLWPRIAAGSFIAALALGAALVGSDQAEAQEQTVASAQEFLQVASNQFRLASSWYESGPGHLVYKNMKFETMGQCVTKISGDFSWDTISARSNPSVSTDVNFQRYLDHRIAVHKMAGSNQALIDLEVSSHLARRLPIDLDWANVTSVITDFSYNSNGPFGEKRVVHIFANEKSYTITTPDAKIAARIAFAAEFLRQNCDATANTGF